MQSHAQVGINTTAPDAQLDIKASDQAAPTNTDGILIPRVDAFPLTSPTAAQQGMMVYLMVTSGANPPGFYYWDNLTTSWIGISSTANGDKDWYKVGTTLSPSDITDDMFHSGKVGIGNSTPTSKLHVMNNASGMTPNPASVATLENNTSAFLNILSGLESGVLFGANGNSTNGGIVYNPITLPNSMLFRTNGNVNRMVISNDGNIALGSFIPTLPLQFPSLLGDKLSLYGGAGAHYGFGIQGNLMQIHSDLVVSDIAFGYGSSGAFTENVRFTGDGFVGIGNSNPTVPLHFPPTFGNKIALWGSGSSNYGFSIQSLALQLHTSNINGDVVFGYGATAALNETMRVKGNGNVGIGETNPVHKLHIKTIDTGMAPTPAASVVIEDDEFTFLNLLSNQESGITFGSNGVPTSGGVIYSPASMPNSLQFRTSTNLNRMTISDVGNVAIGNFKADFPLQFTATFGDKISLWGGAGNHHGFGIQNSLLQIHSDVAVSDIAFGYGSSAAFTENMRIKGNGNLGIGLTNPQTKLHIRTNSTGMTPNPFAQTIIENNDLTFLNLLSNQESGVVFGSTGVATSGGVIYSPASMPNALQFRTSTNLTRMTISDLGHVGIGSFKSDFPLQFDGVLGDKLSLFGGAGNHYGFGLQSALMQIHSAASTDDIAFGYGSSASFTERMRIKGTGEVGIGTSTPTSELEVNGFTKLGGSAAPAVKMIKLTGTTNAAQGSSTSMAHGITSSKILAVNILVEYSAGNSVPPSYNASVGYEYDYYISGTSITVVNKLSNSTFILSKPIRVLVTYEE